MVYVAAVVEYVQLLVLATVAFITQVPAPFIVTLPVVLTVQTLVVPALQVTVPSPLLVIAFVNAALP